METSKKVKIVQGDQYNYYLLKFDNLREIYDYLNETPVNTNAFSKITTTYRDYFYGPSYKEALNNLISDDSDYLKTVFQFFDEGTDTIKDKKVIINVNLGYSSHTDVNVVNRRLPLLMYLVKELEKNGYNVRIDGYEMSRTHNELVNIGLCLKDYEEELNISILVKTLVKKEFLRRILFGVLERVNVKDPDWYKTYGMSCDNEWLKEVLDSSEKQIFVGDRFDLDILEKFNALNDDCKAIFYEKYLKDVLEKEKSL